ncbi:triphosphate tunel metalloenzyme 3-like [Fagus crenata]
MEVEVKLRLPDATTHCHVTTVLTPFHVTTHRQENNFFNGSSNELSSRQAVLHLRFADTNPHCVITLKAKAVIVDGVSRVEEDEKVLDVAIGQECLAEPANPSPRDMENKGERGEQ